MRTPEPPPDTGKKNKQKKQKTQQHFTHSVPSTPTESEHEVKVTESGGMMGKVVSFPLQFILFIEAFIFPGIEVTCYGGETPLSNTQ